jgi:hypothetical protein
MTQKCGIREFIRKMWHSQNVAFAKCGIREFIRENVAGANLFAPKEPQRIE